jgi:hypothetical protein
MGSSTFTRDLFEIENARNLSRDELVATFVPTRPFWRLLSAKNHIVLGARGSGKTALAKMISHDHLARLPDDRARQIIQARSFIGIYVPTSIEWVGGLRNKSWQTEAEAESFFTWRLNIAISLAFLTTLKSCLEQYTTDRGAAARLERTLASQLSREWSQTLTEFETLTDLRQFLEDTEFQRQQQLARVRSQGRFGVPEDPVGVAFQTELFGPLRRAITLTTRSLDFPTDTEWLLCLDEAEFLEPYHHRILNTHLRAHSGNLKFKITTMPYCHYTLETNTSVPVDVGHDFEYVYIDKDPIGLTPRDEGRTFATTLFNKRAGASGDRYQGLSLTKLLGSSVLLDSAQSDWTPSSPNWALLEKYGTPATVARARRLLHGSSGFRDQVARKIQAALLLREEVASQKGREELGIYSGASMAIRCGDGNPRRLIRLFNSLLEAAPWKYPNSRGTGEIPKKEQTRILLSFSVATLSRVQSEPIRGPQLHRFLTAIGQYMHDSLHVDRLTTDQVSSIDLDESISDEQWALVKDAVGLGLLFPNVGPNNPDHMPVRSGIFRLAYVLAPHFRLLPRRGRPQKLSKILTYSTRVERPWQPELFEGGGSGET